jgi:AbrB family looped-hinge helix DNA binding protein
VYTAKVSTKGQIVLPRKLRERSKVRPGDAFEFVEGDEPDVIIMRKIARRPNDGLVDALLACPHRFEVPKSRRRDFPKRPKL